MKQQEFSTFYLGDDLFTAKIVAALFSKKGLKITIANEEKKLFIKIVPGDLILLDMPDQIQDRTDIHQVLLCHQPVSNRFLKYWCKTPVHQETLDNLLFYIGKSDLLVTDQYLIDFSTKRLDGFLGDDEETKKEVVSEFLENLSTNYRVLEMYARSNNTKGVRQIAHKMLSGSGYYEAQELNRLLKILERDGREYSPNELYQYLEQIYHQVVLLRSALIRRFFAVPETSKNS